MAKISSCYQLCPFMDPKNFLGVSGDCESGYVIVTLGRNIVIRYKISDQRQVNSWNTTIKLSAPVVYDKQSERYVGVFNSSIIQMWQQSDVDLSKIKKYKFTNSIHSILASAHVEGLVVLFRNGQVSLLSTALQNRKFSCEPNSSDLLIGEDQIIDDAFLLHMNNNLVVAIKTTNKSKEESKLVFRAVGSSRLRPFSISLNRDQDSKLTGYAFMNEESLQLFTIWSDGNLYALEFSLSTLDSIESQYPGKLIMNVSAVDTKLKVALLPLSPYHIAVYGSDPSEEGALLVIINVWHRLIQCRYFFKLYCTSPKLWHGGASDLLLIVGNHLAVAHFRLVAQQLATLLGTQTTPTPATPTQATPTATDEQHSQPATAEMVAEVPHTPDQLHARIDSLLESGLSEAAIANLFFPVYLEKGDTGMLQALCGSSQLVDVPAEWQLKTLALCMQPGRESIQPLVDQLLSQPVQNDDRTLALARGLLPAGHVVGLIDQLTERLVQRPCCARTLDWATFVVDAFCQHFLFSKDAAANTALAKLRNVIDNQMKNMNVWQELVTLINVVTLKQETKNRAKGSKKDSSIYICEELPLFEK
ncbi:nucleolar protein 11 isoform X2 [Nilaparvata lugens]|uniref:nucleolar protein 11 isoform X2 n=1 Tax=Nilaparvata lugens TaxID=108931 RepID=UPI00193EAD97|nr:nucleolar protein 11 isoform X2 [Nilaparvata lugens]